MFTYLAGQRAVLPKGVCTKLPLRTRINRAINQQAASPSGWFGRVLGFVWPREHRRLNAQVLDALELRPGHRVLEIGSGTGHALREAARRAAPGRVVGIDISELMADLARQLNGSGVARGNVEVRSDDIETLDLECASFDRIFSVHCVYFWRDLPAVIGKLAAALAPDGKLVLAFRPDSDDIPARFRDPTYRFPRVEALRGALERAGLTIDATSPATSPSVVIVSASQRSSLEPPRNT